LSGRIASFALSYFLGMKHSLSLIFLPILFGACMGSSPSPGSLSILRGNRNLGIDLLDITPASSFVNNIAEAKAAGANYMILSLGWNQIEPTTPNNCTTAGTYTDPSGALATFNSLLPANNLKLSLSILPISTSINLMPSNLSATAFDNALVICRFQKMLTFVFAQIPNLTLSSIQFGNEIDAYSGATQNSFWTQYWGFFANASSAAKALRPGVKTSVVGTLLGAIGTSTNVLASGGLAQIWNIADQVVVTYYPLNSNFTVRSPSVVSADISSLTSLYPNKTIFFNEVGYPSGSASDSSSEALQQQFIQAVFTAWDAHANQIQNMAFLRLNDLSPSSAQNLANSYGLGGNASFVEYLQTLGLRTYSGQDKAAYSELKAQASSRNFSAP
jgi:hypothetical protein